MLNAQILKANISQKLTQEGFRVSGDNEKFIAALCEAIIAHLKTAQITGTCMTPQGAGTINGVIS